MSVHYCHGHLYEIKFFSKTVHDSEDIDIPFSNCCDSETHKDCCSNEYYVFQLDIDEEVISATPVVKVKTSSLNINYVDDFDAGLLAEDDSYHFTDLPPPIYTPIWLLNCNFSFYG